MQFSFDISGVCCCIPIVVIVFLIFLAIKKRSGLSTHSHNASYSTYHQHRFDNDDVDPAIGMATGMYVAQSWDNNSGWSNDSASSFDSASWSNNDSGSSWSSGDSGGSWSSDSSSSSSSDSFSGDSSGSW